jgi:hypothetical protein
VNPEKQKIHPQGKDQPELFWPVQAKLLLHQFQPAEVYCNRQKNGSSHYNQHKKLLFIHHQFLIIIF